MPSSAPLRLPSSLLPLLLLLLAAPSLSQLVYVTVPYFNATSLTCDHALNVTLSPAPVTSITWILPDGTTVDAASDGSLDPRRYAFSGPDPSVAIPGVQGSDIFSVYRLTVLRVDDDDFGYYTCVVVGGASGKVSAVIYGLNIDGADFSKLMDEYRENAIVGGVAAAAMLVLVGGACLIWNFRFANRTEDDDANGGAVHSVVEMKHHDNSGYKTDIEMSNIDVAVVGEAPGAGADARM